jgi:hypothetical protein
LQPGLVPGFFARILVKASRLDRVALMARRRNSSNIWWWIAVVVVAIAAVIVVKKFRPPRQVDNDAPAENKETPAENKAAAETFLISTQVLSFSLDSKAELDSVADESGSIWLKTRPERPGAPIVHSDPSPAQMEIYKRDRDLTPSADAAELNKPGVQIVVE